jgi:voltage-gated potassium channel
MTASAGRLTALGTVCWGTLAVPTGIVTAEFTAQRMVREPTTCTCHECLSEGHLPNAKFCRDCGAPLPPYQRDAAGG